MPFIVFTPIIVTVLGRDVMGTLGIAALVSFFLAFVVMLEGMNRTPRPASDVLDLYGASRFAHLRYLVMPATIPYFCTAARLVAPSAILGVMTAEWLSTGYGLGGALDEARGELDFGMSWSIAFITALVSLPLVALTSWIERSILQRYGR
ncbi:ABC transporter permease [Komagataeibacter oboediens]